jgi:mRNA interferase MazF
MDQLNFGDIVLLKFPFTNSTTHKRRPALIINDYNDGDIILCRITSQIYTSRNDIYINDWEKAGLKKPSVVRIHKTATLDKGLVEKIMGKINDSMKKEVRNLFTELTD